MRSPSGRTGTIPCTINRLRLSQQGDFKQGRLWDGKRYNYDKNGMLHRIQIFKHGRYAGDAVITDEDRQ
jgi:antitoxin component YwqK of YwqJK toxin-antitoxin module